MKKTCFLIFFIPLILILVLTGCGSGSNGPSVPVERELHADTNTVALWHFNELSGSIVPDSSTDGKYPLTLASYLTPPVLPTLTNSDHNGFGNCLSVDAVNHQNARYLGTPWINAFSDHKVSVELWCKFSSLPNRSSMLVRGNDVDFMISITNLGKLEYDLADGVNWQLNLISNTILTPNVWHYIACTYDNVANLACIYIDGNLDKNQNPTATCGFDGDLLRGVYIGSQSGDFLFFTGLIDEVRLSNSTRSATEILNYYNQATQP